MELANLIVNIFVAIGTVGAVLIALWNIITENKPKYKIIKAETEEDNNLFYSIEICNVGKIPFIIKNVGFSNFLENKWEEISTEKLLIKKDYKDEYFGDKINWGKFPIKLHPLESLGILISKKEIIKLKENTNKKNANLKIIFFDECKKKVKIKIKEINDYLENYNHFNRK